MVSPPALDDLPWFPAEIRCGEVQGRPVVKPRFPKPAGVDPRVFPIAGGDAAGRILMVTAEDERL